MNRSTSWLETAAAGMLTLVTSLGLTASAQSNALYLEDGAWLNTGLTALTNLHFNVTTITSADSLTNQLATGTWDVVVIEAYDSLISSNSALALKDYVANGGAVILNYWDLNGVAGSSITSSAILRATFGVQTTVSFNDPLKVYVWQPTNSIFTTPYAISGLVTNGTPPPGGWDSGDLMEPGPSSFAQALAGFTINNTYEQAAIIAANNGRTICNGFQFHHMDLTEGPKLLQNEITYVVKPTLLTVDPSMGEFSDRIRVSWNSVAATQYELFRSTNATSGFVSLGVLAGTASNYDDTAVTLPGTYYYYCVNASNAFGTHSVAQPGWRRSMENHAVADYDGDHRADPAIYNGTTGEWAVRFSGNGAYNLFKITLNGMGDPGFIAVTADYDNDGMPDPGVYNASTGEWRILLSGSGYYLLKSTLNNLGGLYFYSALGADYDGDRLADPIVYQETDGSWRFMLSSYDYLQYEASFGHLGGMGWSMAWADYDNDGYADPIVYQETTGTWKLLLSGNGYALTTTTFDGLGGLGFIPVFADYDGDGKIDPAVCNLATGEWRVMMSGNNYARVTAYLTF